jgi:hypothetical protein
MHLLGYLHEDYHDSRSLEHKALRSTLEVHIEGLEKTTKNLSEYLPSSLVQVRSESCLWHRSDFYLQIPTTCLFCTKRATEI